MADDDGAVGEGEHATRVHGAFARLLVRVVLLEVRQRGEELQVCGAAPYGTLGGEGGGEC